MLKTILFSMLLLANFAICQTNIVTYAGNTGKETFYDVMQISDGTLIVTGYADNLDWIPATVTKTQLSFTGTIPNAGGSNRYGFLMHLSNNLQTILKVVHFPQGVVEDIRFLKTNSQPYTTTGDLFISCNTMVSQANNGGYLLAKLNGNFITSSPTALSWNFPVWADGETKVTHPWDVTNAGEIYYVTGKAHDPNWSAIHCLDTNGTRKIVQNWRTHWSAAGAEWKGTPASANPNMSSYSGIALKVGGRCELRSWNATDFNSINPDGNGGTRKGKWPIDFFFTGPCDPSAPTATGPGYNGYSASGKVFGATSIAVDRRNNKLYVGMNMQSYYQPASSPDFEPAVICMDDSGTLLWWSRLYHEIKPDGTDGGGSLPDQYVDALAIDYANNKLVVGARCHGNAVSNFWKGNAIASNPTAAGFQNQFTGSNGNIHISWLGKLSLDAGILSNATYMGEMVDGATNIGTPSTDANLDGWSNPNTGWPDMNTTRIAKNSIKVSSNGDVSLVAVGRRSITTANAYQKMLKQTQGASTWSQIARVYSSNLSTLKYSSLATGTWNATTGAGADNTELFGICKTADGIVCVGKHLANATTGVANGNPMVVTNVVPWGNASPNGESAILVYYKASNIANATDSPALSNSNFSSDNNIMVFPNPTNSLVNIAFPLAALESLSWKYSIIDILGRNVAKGSLTNNTIDLSELNNGIYTLNMSATNKNFTKKIVIQK